MNSNLTYRDREYLRVIFSLNGSLVPIGPVDLAKNIGVSKECAYQKMRRLCVLGYGDYHSYKGIQLNGKAIDLVEQDAKRHHILEQFLLKTLDINHHQACKEAIKLDSSVSANIYYKIKNQINISKSSCCGYDPSKKLTPNKVKLCPWFQNIVKSK